MYVYLIETKVVHSSAFSALFYLTLVLSAILIRSTTSIYGGDRVYADSKARVLVHQLPRSQDCEKLGGGLGTRRRIRLGTQVSRVIKPKRFYAGLMKSVSCSMGLINYSKFIC